MLPVCSTQGRGPAVTSQELSTRPRVSQNRRDVTSRDHKPATLARLGSDDGRDDDGGLIETTLILMCINSSCSNRILESE